MFISDHLLHRSQTLQTQEMLKKILIFTTLLPPLDAGVLPKSILVDIVLERGKVVLRMVLNNLNTKTPSKMDVAPWDKHWIKRDLDGFGLYSMVFVEIQ